MINAIQKFALPPLTAAPAATAPVEQPRDTVTLSRVDDPVLPPGKPDRDRLTNLFLELVQLRGGTRNERAVADRIKATLDGLGLQAREDGAGAEIGGNTGNLIVDIPGTIPDAPGLIFMAHMDTVRSAVGAKPILQDGVVRTDGSTALGGDNRAGCTEILEMLRILKDNSVPHPPLQIIFTVGEEGGLLGSSALRREDVHGRLGYAVDSFKPNDIFWGWDGPLFIDEPEAREGAWKIAEQAFRRPTRASDELKPRNIAEGFLLDFTRAGIRDIGMEPAERNLWGASSDAAALRDMGIPAMTIGAGEQDIHTREEHIAIDDIVKSTELLLALVKRANSYQVAADGQIVPR